LCLDQLVDQGGSGSEAHAPPLAAGGDGQTAGQMGFSRPRFADQKYRLGAFQIALISLL
jgi:hypothetical protein